MDSTYFTTNNFTLNRLRCGRTSVAADTQKKAFEATRDLAQKAKSEVSIHRADNNRIRAKHSYGNDPESTKG